MSHIHSYDDVDMGTDMAPLPASFLARLQPAGAFLHAHAVATSVQSPTALASRPGGLTAPELAPLKSLTHAHIDTKSKPSPAVAMSFMSAMRRGLDGLNDSDDDDEEDEDDDDEEEEGSGYYQPAYSQYHAPTTSFTGRASAPLLGITTAAAVADDEELIFPMEM